MTGGLKGFPMSIPSVTDNRSGSTRKSQPIRKTFRLPVSTGIFEHYQALGDAIWLLLWLIDATTEEIDGLGIVRGGGPISSAYIARSFGCSPKTIDRWRKILVDSGYIAIGVVPGGCVYAVRKSKKWGWKSTDKNVRSLQEVTPRNGESDSPNRGMPSSKRGDGSSKRGSGNSFTEQDTTDTRQQLTNRAVGGGRCSQTSSSDGTNKKPSLERAAEVFAEATGGRRFGFAGKRLSKWRVVVKEHGEDVAIEAVRVWAETLDARAFDGPSALRNPVAAFLAHAADEAIAQAKVEIAKKHKHEAEIAERKAGRERTYAAAVEKYGQEKVAREEDLPKDAPISSIRESRLMFWYGNYWGPLEDAESFLKRQEELAREIAEKRERERREQIEIRTLELLDERFGFGYSPVSEEEKSAYEAARDECEARAIEQVEKELNANTRN